MSSRRQSGWPVQSGIGSERIAGCPVDRQSSSWDRPTLAGKWEHLADLDPAWLFRVTQASVLAAKRVGPTRENMNESIELASKVYAQLPLHLRPVGDVRPDLRRQGRQLVLVHPVDHETTDVFAFKRSDERVWHIRLSARTASATATIYRHGAPWMPLFPAYVGENYPDSRGEE